MHILIATVTAGAGHLQAAAALEETWKGLRPSDRVECIDLLQMVPRLQGRLYAQGYVKMVEHAPELWGLMFKKTDNPGLVRKLTRFRRTWARATNPRFTRYLQRFRPAAVLCTHYLPLEVLGHLRSRGQDLFSVSVVTDFEAHALWMEQAVNLYCVAADSTRNGLLARGAPADQVVVTGIPVSVRFRDLAPVREVRRQIGLRDDLPTLLVLGGGFGMGPVADIVRAVDQTELPVQILVVAGRNHELRAALATEDFRHPTRILGFVTDMQNLMQAADLILTKPGGLTTSEALAVGRPILILNPIPGQESANSDFLLEQGAAVKVNHTEDIGFRLNELLPSPQLRALRRTATRLGRPLAAQTVCEEVLRRLGA